MFGGGFAPCSSIIQFYDISLVHSILVHFGHVQMVKLQAIYWKWVVHLYLCHVTGTIVTFQQTNYDYVLVKQVVLMTKFKF